MRSTGRITIREVAAISGVSVSTVSNVLNGRVRAMSPETRQRVEGVIRSLDYRPSQAARSLVTQRTASIGLVIDEIDTPLFLRALSAMEPIARESGYNLLVCHASTIADEESALTLLLDRGVDGMAFIATSEYRNQDHLLRLVKAGVPTVLINRPQPHREFARVGWDNCQGVIDALSHLYKRGHRRIALLRGPRNRQSAEERLRGYQLGLEQCELASQPELVETGDYSGSWHELERATLKLLGLAEPPTAVVAADDIAAAIVMRTAYRHGVHVPNDLAVVGVDDQPFAQFLSPSLTTVRLPVAEAGTVALQALLRRIQGDKQNWGDVTLPTTLVIRESSGSGTAQSEVDPKVSSGERTNES